MCGDSRPTAAYWKGSHPLNPGFRNSLDGRGKEVCQASNLNLVQVMLFEGTLCWVISQRNQRETSPKARGGGVGEGDLTAHHVQR